MSKLLGSLNERRRLKYAIHFEQQIAKDDSFWDFTDVLNREQELKHEVLNSKLRRQTFALKEESRRLDKLMIVGNRLQQKEDTIVTTETTKNTSTCVQNERLRQKNLTLSSITVYSQDPLKDSGAVSPSPVKKAYYWLQQFVCSPARRKLARLKASFLEITNNRNTVQRSPTVVTRDLKMR
ncbi:Hypp6422 [Branchiostoma lanceolatum]|uniref:Hypp6422 protein n=1 Tax=Branchiostoma lanceolatum TaxID=7740 RepID=A0A8J9YU95_BRALA|nr:Hypp6422 [Branchiostoma lanceolatum]